MPSKLTRPYVGRFAPSPTGALHAGSLVAALASWLDARAHGGRWLVRMEDVDSARCQSGLAAIILQQLAACGLHSDQPPVYQSQRSALYQQALDDLLACGLAYPCACTRKDITDAMQQQGLAKTRHGELIYPGSCRAGLRGKVARAWRLRTDVYRPNRPLALIKQAPEAIDLITASEPKLKAEVLKSNWRPALMEQTLAAIDSEANQALMPRNESTQTDEIHWTDRRLGAQHQMVAQSVGDFILKRADGCFAYQLAVVADDAAQGITDVVRGADLADNTARQILLQRALNLPTPRYLHTPLVLGPNGEKLSKQNGAQALDTSQPLEALNRAAAVLGLTLETTHLPDALHVWVSQWQQRWSCLGPD